MSRELKGIVIVLGIYLFGDVVSRLVGGFMPGSIIGMITLFVLLQLRVVNEEDIKGVCNFMLNNMMLLFVPVIVGIMASYTLIIDSLPTILVSLILSTIIIIVSVGKIQQTLGRKWKR